MRQVKRLLSKLDHTIGKINIYIYEGGLSCDDVESLARLVGKLKGNDLQVAEVGSWTGCSTFVLANEVRGRGKVFAIDHWKGTGGAVLEWNAKHMDALAIFKQNMIDLEVWDTIHVMRMTSLEAVKKFKDGTLDLVFIDANHRYKHITEDIQAWLPKVKAGGILCGHDAEGKYSQYTTRERELIDEYLDADCIKGISKPIHGGVIKTLYDCFDDKHTIMPQRMWCYTKGEDNENPFNRSNIPLHDPNV